MDKEKSKYLVKLRERLNHEPLEVLRNERAELKTNDWGNFEDPDVRDVYTSVIGEKQSNLINT